jgi:hypothetical protein
VLEQAAFDFVQIEKIRRFDSRLLSDLDQLRGLEETTSLI